MVFVQHSTNTPHIVDAGLRVPTDEAQERREIKQFGSAGVGEHRVSERLEITESIWQRWNNQYGGTAKWEQFPSPFLHKRVSNNGVTSRRQTADQSTLKRLLLRC